MLHHLLSQPHCLTTWGEGGGGGGERGLEGGGGGGRGAAELLSEPCVSRNGAELPLI